MICRIYTGADGKSHFEDIDLDKGPVEWEKMQASSGVMFRRSEPGNFQDWHCAPRRQYVITLKGGMEIGIGDGTIRRFGPGDVLLADDLTGQGHTTRIIGTEPRISVTVPLE
ncbi:MAG: hypothetical protein L0177_07010 [Chloroflexi bacterium]|nr:hypothetical protein [Chloroflexota bacterium]